LRRTFPLLAVICVPSLLSCGNGEPACETREAGLGQQRWILECEAGAGIPDANLVASYFDPEWTETLPSSVHIYCSDRGPTFAWSPGVRTADRSGRWRDKAVFHRVDGGRRVQDRWMVSTDDRGRPTYHLFGPKAATFVEALREARELLLETRLDQDEEPTLRLVTLEGLREILERIACFPED
jgi:hypothetical protein